MTLRRRAALLATLAICTLVLINMRASAKQSSQDSDPAWQILASGEKTNLRGLSVVARPGNPQPLAIWASGSNGTVLRSVDGGARFARLRIPGGETLDFRGVYAIGARTAYLMSSGEGEKSRIYKTTDGGLTWKQEYAGSQKEVFLDGIHCRSEDHCLALGDPVEGKFLLLETTDGRSWRETHRDTMPAAIKGEGAFAASGTSLILCSKALLFGTGGGATRVFRSTDFGLTWNVAEVPMSSGNASSGIFSLACSGQNVVAVGGDYKQLEASIRTAAYSNDGGISWKAAPEPPSGYRSAAAFLVGQTFWAVGPNGTDISGDGGAHWTRVSNLGFNTLAIGASTAVFGGGANGTVARIRRR